MPSTTPPGPSSEVDPARLGDAFGLFTRHDLTVAARSESEIRHRVRRGEWVRVRRGVYMDAALFREAASDESTLHRVHAAAVLRTSRTKQAVVSGRSAALVHGFPLLHLAPSVVEVSLPRTARGSLAGVRERTTRTAWHPDDLAERHGIPVTSAARTVLDIALTSTRREAAVVVDAALGSGTVSQDELAAVAARLARTVPSRQLDAAVRLLRQGEPLIGEPLLSVVRRDALDAGMPKPSVITVQLAPPASPAAALQWGRTPPVTLVLEGHPAAARVLRAMGDAVLVAEERDVLHRSGELLAALRRALHTSRDRAA